MREPSEFLATARRLLDQAGRHDVTITVTRSNSAHASAGLDRIKVGRGMADQPPKWQRWSAAHEAAHAVLRHGGPPAGVYALLGLAALSCVVLGVLAAAPSVHLPPAPATAAVIVAGVGALIGLFGWLIALGRHQRPAERAADELAARWGFPITADIADQIARTEARWIQGRFFLPFRQHDLPADRHQAMVARGGETQNPDQGATADHTQTGSPDRY